MNRAILFLCVLCTALLGSNGYLLYINHDLIQQHKIDQAIQLPTLDAPISPIAVHSAQGAAHPLVFGPDATHDRLLLVLSPDCPYCKKNWPMWDALIEDLGPGVDTTYFDVTGKFDQKVSSEHHIPSEQLVTASLDSTIMARIIGTPTTILIGRNGKVRHVWQGVLDGDALAQIVAMSKADVTE
ncbi:hypothetical protein ACN9MB_01990 [Dyella kyungheensis]|uniref:hypothetical protein n=1 Tax=Dyella kyungheensis TaxID=1242174 RepID=UPI003CEC725D